MSKPNRWPLSTWLVLGALLGSVSCTSSDEGAGPAQTEPPQAPGPWDTDFDQFSDSSSSGSGGSGSGSWGDGGSNQGNQRHLSSCPAQRDDKKKEEIGPLGGTLYFGKHKLVIPEGALASEVEITGEQLDGNGVSVRLKPEGLQFAIPALLVLSYADCASDTTVKLVVYTDEQLKVLEAPPSLDYSSYSAVTAVIGHFSRYAVAF